MKKIYKLLIASLLTVSLGVATVICCCTAPSVMAHFHKVVACSHCPVKHSHNKSPSPMEACQYQLTSAEFSYSQSFFTSTESTNHFPVPVLFSNHQANFTHALLLAYPPAGPPLGIRFTPLYLRTFNLRV